MRYRPKCGVPKELIQLQTLVQDYSDYGARH
jgi:hypothetical protein